MKVIITKGLPASGKTTFAKDLIEKNHETWKRINKDDLRAMLDNGKWGKNKEQFIIKVRDMLIIEALNNGYNVIVDDTNLHQKHFDHIKAMLADRKDIEIELADFTDVPLDECIARDQKREHYVGEKVIRGMYNQFLKPKPKIALNLPGLARAIVCDIDGTLALFGEKNPYERDFINDQVNEPVAQLLRDYANTTLDPAIIIVSGRKGFARKETEEWLSANRIPYDFLYMRPEDDNRKDVLIKQEIYEQSIKGKYNVMFVLDDRNQIVEFWRNEGLTVFQVNYGDF